MSKLTEQRTFHSAKLRRTVLEMAYAGSTVHIGCAFSIVELLAVLYRNHLRYPGNEPRAAGRDYLVLSKGHGVMAQYACMRELGWIGDTEVRGYFRDGSHLKGLSDSRVPGLEVTSGSRDMVHWLTTMLLQGKAGAAYNVGSDQGMSMAELAHQVVHLISPGKRVVIENTLPDDGARSRYVPDITKASTLGLRVETSLADAILATAAAASDRP